MSLDRRVCYFEVFYTIANMSCIVIYSILKLNDLSAESYVQSILLIVKFV